MQNSAELRKCIDEATEFLISDTNRIRFNKSIASEFEKLQTELDRQKTKGYIEYSQHKKLEKTQNDTDFVITDTRLVDNDDGAQLEIISSILDENNGSIPKSKVVFQSDKAGQITYKAMQMCKSEETDDYEEVLKRSGVYHQFKHNQQNNLVINKLYWDVKEVAEFFNNNINVLEFTDEKTQEPNPDGEIKVTDICNEIIEDASTKKKKNNIGIMFFLHEIAIAVGMMASFYKVNWGTTTNIITSSVITVVTMLSFVFVHLSYYRFKENDTKSETRKKMIPYLISVLLCVGLCVGSVFFFMLKDYFL